MVASFRLELWPLRSEVSGLGLMTVGRAGQRIRTKDCQGHRGSNWHQAQPHGLLQIVVLCFLSTALVSPLHYHQRLREAYNSDLLMTNLTGNQSKQIWPTPNME